MFKKPDSSFYYRVFAYISGKGVAGTLSFLHTGTFLCAYFSVITVKEIQKRKEISYLLNGNSVRELTEVLKRVEFRIWELEFERTPEAENHLYETMQQYFITPEAMSCIIVVSAMDKCDTYLTVSCIYLEHGNTEAAIDLLVYSLEWYPEDERILQVLVSLYRKTGKQELAESYEERLKCVQQ